MAPLCVILLLWGVQVKAQDEPSCISKLDKAHKLYNEGQLSEVAPLIDGCLTSGQFSKEEELDALRLLTLVNIFDDQDQVADQYMGDFLSKNPEYEINQEKDPIEFIRLYETFNTLPILGVGISAGSNYSFINVLERFGVNNIVETPGSYKGEAGGFHVGLRVSKYILPGLWAELNAQYNNVVFSYENTLFDFAGLSLRETQTWIDIPLVVGYEFNRHKKLRPYIGIGTSMSLLLTSSMDASRVYTDNALPEVQGPDIDVIDHRQSSSLFLIGAAGIKYKVPRGFITLDLRYEKGLINQVVESRRYQNSELLYKYFYVDDNFVLNNFTGSLGYTYLLYNPKKKKSKK